MNVHIVPAIGMERGPTAYALAGELGLQRNPTRRRVLGRMLQLEPMEAAVECPTGCREQSLRCDPLTAVDAGLGKSHRT